MLLVAKINARSLQQEGSNRWHRTGVTKNQSVNSDFHQSSEGLITIRHTVKTD